MTNTATTAHRPACDGYVTQFGKLTACSGCAVTIDTDVERLRASDPDVLTIATFTDEMSGIRVHVLLTPFDVMAVTRNDVIVRSFDASFDDPTAEACGYALGSFLEGRIA